MNQPPLPAAGILPPLPAAAERLVVARADTLDAAALAACDFSFDVSEEAVPPFDGDDIVRTVPVPPYRKAYDIDGGLEAEEGGTLFAATLGGKLCGYAAVSRGWNGFAQLDDIAVDRAARGCGVGAELLQAALAWAQVRGLPGMRLETQSNNVAACRFYARHGFQLGGHDRHLYALLELERPEIALYWYRFFAHEGLAGTR